MDVDSAKQGLFADGRKVPEEKSQHRQHIVKLQQPDILTGYFQLLDKGGVFGKPCPGKQHFYGNGHHGAGGKAVKQSPFGIGVKVGGQNLHAGFFNRAVLVCQLDLGEGVVMLDIAPVGVLASMVLAVIFKIHIHHNLVGGVRGFC